MRIVNLPPGEPAPEDRDCIGIQQMEDGRHALTGSALMRCGDAESTESVAIGGVPPYDSYEAAEAAGLAWAEQQCVAELFVSRSDGTQPLPDIFRAG